MNIRHQAYEFLLLSPLRKYAHDLAELIEPSIRITTHADDWSSQSHFGGFPKVPIGFELPMSDDRPLNYLGQIHLDELPKADLTNLPLTGILYFFADLEGRLNQQQDWKCIYLEIPADELVLNQSHAECSAISPCRNLSFHVEWMFGSPEYKVDRINQISDEIGGLGNVSNPGVSSSVIDEMCHRFEISRQSGWVCDGVHRLLGYPTIIQSLMERECQLRFHKIDGYQPQSEIIEAGVQDWQLLIQLDSDRDLDWDFGDSGNLDFWIRRQDLAKRDFSNVWLTFKGA